MRLFICTETQDEADLETLTDVLDGYRMTIDVDRIIGERDSRPTLQASIQDCEAFVFALTPNTVSNRRCHWEFSQAVANERPVIIAMLRPVEPFPAGLEDFLVIDMTDPEGAEQLLDALYVVGATPPSILQQLFRNRLLLSIVVLIGITAAWALAGPRSPYREDIAAALIGVVQVADRADNIYNAPLPTPDPTLVALQQPLQQMTLSANANQIFQEGQLLARDGDHAAAINAFNQTLSITPGAVGAHIARANAYLAINEPDTAWGDYSRAIELAPGLALPWASRAAFYVEVDKPEPAIADADRALSIEPSDVSARVARARALALQNNYTAALADLDTAITADPRNAAALTYRGDVQRATGNTKQALADYDTAISVNPIYGRAYTRRGSLRLAAGEDATALSDFDRAVELEDADAEARAGRGELLAERGDYPRAITDFTRAISGRPNEVRLFHLRGTVYRCAGQPALAVADFTRAAEMNLDATATYLGRARAYTCAGETPVNLNNDRIGATDPNLDGAYLFLANALAARADERATNGNTAAAIADLTLAARMNPAYTETASFYAQRGELREASGEIQAALSDYLLAVDIVPEEAAYHIAVGRMLARTGEPEEAVRRFTRAISLDAGSVDGHLALGDLYAAQDRTALAFDSYTRASYIQQENPAPLIGRVRMLLELDNCTVAIADAGRLADLAPDDPDATAAREAVRAACEADTASSQEDVS